MALIAAIVLTILFVIPLWKIFQRTGLHPAMSLLSLIPLIGPVVATAVLALSEWPSLDKQPRQYLSGPDDKEKLP